METIIGRGAEALLYLDNGVLVKERVQKNYRLQEIDDELRKFRTRREGKILHKLKGIVPDVFDVDDKDMKIRMEFIDGHLIRDVLDGKSDEDQRVCMVEIGKIIGTIHGQDIIHGDLTTSNMIEKDGKVVFIDFGLGFFSTKVEDKAVDLHVLRQALESKHYKHAEQCYEWFMEGYHSWDGAEAVLERLEQVEKRGRYKKKQS